MAGLFFDQFWVGQTFQHEIRRTVTDMDNMLFSSLIYNPAPIHIDAGTLGIGGKMYDIPHLKAARRTLAGA